MGYPTTVEEENETFFIRVWKPLPSRRVLKTWRESPNRTISTSGGLGLLQMVSESDIERCANEETKLRRRANTRPCARKDVGPRKEGGLGVPHRLEKGTSVSEEAGL